MLSHEKPMQLTHCVKKFLSNTPFLSDNARPFLYGIAVVGMGGRDGWGHFIIAKTGGHAT